MLQSVGVDALFSDGLAERAVVEVEAPLPAVAERPDEGFQGAVHLRPLEHRQESNVFLPILLLAVICIQRNISVN